MQYESTAVVESARIPGVSFRVARISFGRRLEFTRRVRELAQKIPFLEAGGRVEDKLEGALLSGEIEQLYLTWGLLEIRGLEVDGAPATPESLMNAGPEELCREALDAVRAQFGLTSEERKN